MKLRRKPARTCQGCGAGVILLDRWVEHGEDGAKPPDIHDSPGCNRDESGVQP